MVQSGSDVPSAGAPPAVAFPHIMASNSAFISGEQVSAQPPADAIAWNSPQLIGGPVQDSTHGWADSPSSSSVVEEFVPV
eukprot:SAG31_NODE_15913_length_732_cov_0.816746_1_plen_80_part_00